MIERLLNTKAITRLERVVSFTEGRHGLILENIANASTPGYVQKDVSPREFQALLARAEARKAGDPPVALEGSTVALSATSTQVALRPKAVRSSQAFYDRGVRSMEDLMAQLADNAQAHNMAAQMLKGKYDGLAKAISMKV